MVDNPSFAMSRRNLLRGAGAVALGGTLGGTLIGCASEEDSGPAGPGGDPSQAPSETFTEPTKKLSTWQSLKLSFQSWRFGSVTPRS